MHYACAYGHPDIVTILLRRNCDIELCDSYKSTALLKASQNGYEESLTILLEHGANAKAIDNSGSTALHYAVYYIENISMVSKLLEYQQKEQGKNQSLIKLVASKDTIKRTEEADEPDR
ncbi:ankyrin repeat domain-containing protein 26-like [Mesocricetus auratus]|uniref:Ankyrin repeat domain-containing protein 26-like n=1 Tax=Mesocricetus auratus TaxID=10036 RepID=A0ABM2X301_MESAU|nr:ankyrin repeat domain-containing protein 26-like [Mesocricetus auratus]